MARISAKGFEGRILRADLSARSTSTEIVDGVTMRTFVGGTGLGAKILYDEVPPGVEWSDPENRLIVSSGPLGGTKMMGSGTFSIVTKGSLTNGATSSQANGFMGAYMRFNGYDSIVVQGASDKLVYLYIHDGIAELRDASHLAGKDTWETEDAIAAELGLGGKQLSVYSIGPAGENLVKYAAVVGDKGHVAGHNGTGAVMGSKKLKAIAVARGKSRVPVHDPTGLASAASYIAKANRLDPYGKVIHEWGTGNFFCYLVAGGTLPVKNYTTSLFAEPEPFMAVNYRTRYKIKPHPCWACTSHHIHMMTIPDGPYAGYVGEEPDAEQWCGWSSTIGNTDPDGAMVLANETDRLGLEGNEASWIIAWVMECFEKGIFTEEMTDGLKMTWGNVEATRAMLYKIARRQGFGNLLAEGVMRASQQIGGEAAAAAIYCRKGFAPRAHDHRAHWPEMFDTIVSNTGTIEAGWVSKNDELGIEEGDHFSGPYVSTALAKFNGMMSFEDSLGACRFCLRGERWRLVSAVNAVTGWNMDVTEAMEVGKRIVNVLRSFNVRHGIAPELDAPSARWASVPTDGPAKGRDIVPELEGMLENYYRLMGWDRMSGKPFPETLRRYGLERQVEDLWGAPFDSPGHVPPAT